ncbi:MAG: hypothetical protein KUG77_18490 [Nannocystaceae bacterium]|nr:hypothetical protein [Nannocystaceae bacterium]
MIADFQCPFCQRVQSTIRALERRNGSDLRIVVKHNPLAFHKRARPAALALPMSPCFVWGAAVV